MSGAASREKISIFLTIDLIKACYDQAHLAEILPGKGLGRVSSFGRAC